MQQSLHEARNNDKVWNTKVLPLQRKLQSRLKGVVPQESPPKALESRTLHVHTDHLGTPRELTNADGHIVWAASPRQHPNGNQKGQGIGDSARTDFNKWREDYWRARAQEELDKRNGCKL